MSKPIYKAQDRPYGTEDINDLIEKGGEGSGQKGHKTNNQSTIAGNKAKGLNPKISLEAISQRLDAEKFKHKPMPRPVKKSDINDDVEELVNKGGEGSGQKGHITPEDERIHRRMKSGSFNAIHTAVKHFSAKHDAARQYGHKEHQEHYSKLRNEAQMRMMHRLDQGTKDMKKSEIDQAKEYDSLRKKD